MAVHSVVFDNDNLRETISHYVDDRCLGPIVAAMKGAMPAYQRQHVRQKRLLPRFRFDGWRLMYGNQLCVPRVAVSVILGLARDSKAGGHFGVLKPCPA